MEAPIPLLSHGTCFSKFYQKNEKRENLLGYLKNLIKTYFSFKIAVKISPIPRGLL